MFKNSPVVEFFSFVFKFKIGIIKFLNTFLHSDNRRSHRQHPRNKYWSRRVCLWLQIGENWNNYKKQRLERIKNIIEDRLIREVLKLHCFCSIIQFSRSPRNKIPRYRFGPPLRHLATNINIHRPRARDNNIHLRRLGGTGSWFQSDFPVPNTRSYPWNTSTRPLFTESMQGVVKTHETGLLGYFGSKTRNGQKIPKKGQQMPKSDIFDHFWVIDFGRFWPIVLF